MRKNQNNIMVLVFFMAALSASCQARPATPQSRPALTQWPDSVTPPRFYKLASPCETGDSMKTGFQSASGTIAMPNAMSSARALFDSSIPMPNACAPRDSGAAALLKRWSFE